MSIVYDFEDIAKRMKPRQEVASISVITSASPGSEVKSVAVHIDPKQMNANAASDYYHNTGILYASDAEPKYIWFCGAEDGVYRVYSAPNLVYPLE